MYPSICLSIYLPICLSIYLYLSLSIYRTIYLSTYQSIYLSAYLSVCLSVDLSIFLSICLSVCLSIHLSICKLENQTILPNFFMFQSWQHQKRSNSARLPHVSKLTTSKTQQFCETSSFFEVDNITSEAILRDFFIFWTGQHQKQSNSARLPSKMESWVQSWRPRTNAFCDFSTPPV